MNDPYLTDWARREHEADNGQLAEIIQGYSAFTTWFATHGHQIAAMTGRNRQLAPPAPYMLPVAGDTDAERIARVDAFARLVGVTAAWDNAGYLYQAVKAFGPVHLVVYTIPEGLRRDQLAPVPAARTAGEPVAA